MSRRIRTKRVWAVLWSNPYTKPTGEYELGRVEVMSSEDPHWRNPPQWLRDLAWNTPGYSLNVGQVRLDPPRRWSKQAKARNRRKRLRKRLERKVPLFADMFYEDALADDSEGYYDGEEYQP